MTMICGNRETHVQHTVLLIICILKNNNNTTTTRNDDNNVVIPTITTTSQRLSAVTTTTPPPTTTNLDTSNNVIHAVAVQSFAVADVETIDPFLQSSLEPIPPSSSSKRYTIMILLIVFFGTILVVIAASIGAVVVKNSNTSSTPLITTTTPTASAPITKPTAMNPPPAVTPIMSQYPSTLQPQQSFDVVKVPTIIQPTNVPITNTPTIITIQPQQQPVPTNAICNICTNGTTTSNDIIFLDVGNISCVDASDAGMSGLILSSNCEVLQQYVADNNVCSCINDIPTIAPSPLSYDQCNICGDGFVVTIIEGKLPIFNSTEPPLNCGFVDQAGVNGLLDPTVCAYYTSQATDTSNPCGCIVDTNTTSPAGTNALSTEFSPCFICGNESEHITAVDTIVELPDEFLDTISNETNSSSTYTCKGIEQSGGYNTSYNILVCSYLQIVVKDVCECQAI